MTAPVENPPGLLCSRIEDFEFNPSPESKEERDVRIYNLFAIDSAKKIFTRE